jgi:riboflavin synthase
MFTGIIKRISKVANVSEKKGSIFISIFIPRGWKVKNGDSISINGVCSTIQKTGKKIFEVEYMPETINKTTVGFFKKCTEINLEKSLAMSDLLDGHIVQGHIDTRGKIVGIKKARESKIIKIKIPVKFMKFVAKKGSVSVDGISLTVVDAGKDWFSVSLVSYTLKNTNLGNMKLGENVNIETDILAKYLDKLLKSKK